MTDRVAAGDKAADPVVLMTADEVQRLLASDPSLAETRARRILNETPANPGALWVLGAALRRQHKSAEARAVLEPLVDSHPHLPHALIELGRAFADLELHREAVDVLSRTVDLVPSYADAWCALGDQLSMLDQPKCEHSGRLAIGEGAIDDPRLRAARDASTNGQLDTATRLLGEWLEFQPDDAAARFRLAALLFAQGKTPDALVHTETLLRRDPGNFHYRALKAASLVRMEEFARAIQEYEILLQDGHDRPGAWMGYGRALRGVGRDEECVAAFRKSIEILPGFIDAYWSLATVKTFRFGAADVEALRAQAARTDLIAKSRAEFHFALGKALEDVGEYAESFENYRTSNLLQRANHRYDANEHSRYFRRLKEVFLPAFLRDCAGTGTEARDPIFIVGMPRAGSTLIEQILASHSAVEGLGELPYLKSAVQFDGTASGGNVPRRYLQGLKTVERDRFKALGQQYLAQVGARRKSSRPHFTDKMPSNFVDVGLIHLILPNAKIIDARRHPLDCCVSCFTNYFPGGQPFTHTLGDLGRYYADYVELMAHYDDVLPGKVHRVIYEHLVDDPDREVRRLLDFLELPFEEQCLRFHEQDRAVLTLSSEQVRMPIHKKSFEAWRRYEPWLDPLKQALGYVLDVYPAVPKYYASIRVRMVMDTA